MCIRLAQCVNDVTGGAQAGTILNDVAGAV